MGFSLRAATPDDAPALARVHIAAWRETYAGLLPRDHLDRLPDGYERRVSAWRERAASPERVVLVAESEGAVAGFAAFEPARDARFAPRAELAAIYLLKASHGKGIGRALLREGFSRLRARGFAGAYCWVLDGNPAARFYERTGAVLGPLRKTELVGGAPAPHLSYVWDSLD